MTSISSGSLDPLGRALQRVQLERRYETGRQLERLAAEPRGEDSVRIGGDDRTRLQELLLDSAAGLPDVRQERVAEVRGRIEAGYYNREDVVDKIGERFLASPEGRQAVEGATRAALPADAERADLMREVRDKLKAGFYTDNEVMGFVADRLLDLYQIDDKE